MKTADDVYKAIIDLIMDIPPSERPDLETCLHSIISAGYSMFLGHYTGSTPQWDFIRGVKVSCKAVEASMVREAGKATRQ